MQDKLKLLFILVATAFSIDFLVRGFSFPGSISFIGVLGLIFSYDLLLSRKTAQKLEAEIAALREDQEKQLKQVQNLSSQFNMQFNMGRPPAPNMGTGKGSVFPPRLS